MKLSFFALSCFLLNQSKNFLIYKKRGKRWVRVDTKFKITSETIKNKLETYGPAKKGDGLRMLRKLTKIFKRVPIKKVRHEKHESFSYSDSRSKFIILVPADSVETKMGEYDVSHGWSGINIKNGEKLQIRTIEQLGMMAYFILYFSGELSETGRRQFAKFIHALETYLEETEW
jgi:hypothetical protein